MEKTSGTDSICSVNLQIWWTYSTLPRNKEMHDDPKVLCESEVIANFKTNLVKKNARTSDSLSINI